jgi:dihydrodipicolinate synthase/N-acetylneuraminate lyase
MEALSVNNLTGSWGTLLIPVNTDNSIDYGCLENELDFLCNSGISGIYSNGTAGEFFNQTEDEFDKIQFLMAEKCNKNNIPFQIGACHMSPIISFERIERSKFLNPGAFQVIFPDWLPVTSGEQILFLKKAAEATAPVPIVLYNPGHSKTVLQPQDFSRLHREISALIGVKVAAKEQSWFDAMKVHGEGLSVFIQGHRLATGIKERVAAGSYSNIACLNPLGAVAWYHLMQENIQEALVVEKRIADFFENCIFPFAKAGYSDPALDKLLAFAGGWSSMSTRIRFPYKWVDEEDALKVRQQAKKMLPELITRF